MVHFLIIKELEFQKKMIFNDCLFVTGGKSKMNQVFLIENLDVRLLDMAYVASGRYDGYFQNDLNLWDIAAGIIIIKRGWWIINEIDLSVNKNIKIIASSLI